MTTETADQKRERVNDLWKVKLAADLWNGWRALLQNWKIEDVGCPIWENEPFQGYYRSRRRQDKTFEPVAFFRQENKWVCLRPKRDPKWSVVREGDDDWARVLEAWKHIARYPISHAWYKAVAEEGKPWPDADAHTTSEALAASAVAPKREEPAKIGDNNPPEETPVEALRNQIANAGAGVVDYAKIKDGETLAKARSLKNRLTELAGLAEKARVTEKKPHWDAAKAVDDKWMPVVKQAEALAAQVNKFENDYATELLKKQREDEKRVADANAEAERIRIANEAKTQQAEATGTTAELEKVPETVAPKTAPIADTSVRPGYGRAARITTEKYVKAITDIDKLFAFLKTHPELKAKMLELAERALEAGMLDAATHGVEIDERAKVK